MRLTNSKHDDGTGGRTRFGRLPSLSKFLGVVYVTILGILVGWQIFDPSKRFIEAVVGLVLVGVVWNFSGIQPLWLILIIYPFPFCLSFGNSTFIFTLVVFVVYMVHVSTGKYRFRGDKLLNLPIGLLVLATIVSFYNQSGSSDIFKYAVRYTGNFFVILLFYYMLVNLVDTEKNLTRTIGIFMVSTFLVTFFAFLELLFPGRVILPNLIYSVYKAALVMKDIRVKGPFHDYELLAEFFAMNVPIIILMVMRSRRLLVRSMYVALLIFVLFMQFSTITRGAFVSLMVGLVYMAWICRKDLNIVSFTGLAAALVGLLVVIDAVMSRYTVSGSLFARLLGTTLKHGVIPDTRIVSWTGAVHRWLLHPFIGNGPGWDFTHSLEAAYWPHSAYLHYLNDVGIFGTAAVLLLLYRLMRASLKEVRHSLITSPFPTALMKTLNVTLVILIIDMIKIDFQRNLSYQYFIWVIFALISASRKIIDKTTATARADASGSAAPE
jgi:hypothetical protein